MAKERIMISFLRSKISKTTSEYLCSKLDKEIDQELIMNITLLQTGVKKIINDGIRLWNTAPL